MSARNALSATLVLIAAFLFGGAAAYFWNDMRVEGSYDGLARISDSKGVDDLRWMLGENPESAGWIGLPTNGIDYPVVYPSPDHADGWYLNHAFDQSPTYLGCPYIDERCDPDGSRLLIYGHHIKYSDKMFSQIHDAWRPEAFDRIGKGAWQRIGYMPQELTPLMAMKVDKRYDGVQDLSDTDGEGLREWLAALARDADALSENSEEIISTAERAVILVTCSEMFSGGDTRTLLVLVADENAQTA